MALRHLASSFAPLPSPLSAPQPVYLTGPLCFDDQVAELSKKNDVLLELLGEKTEECEALTEELGNLKSHFRKQLDDLIERREESPSVKSAH